VGVTVVVPLLGYDLLDRSALSTASPIMSITLGETAGTVVLIVLAGLLASNRWVLAGTTLLMNVFTVFILASALEIPAGRALRDEAALLLSFPLLVQWAVTGILVAASSTYLSTLRELGDVRVAYERAQQLDRLKDEFITHVNHELRGPVMVLQGQVELLLLAEATLSPEERRSYLERAKRAGDALVDVVRGVLAIQRLERDAEAITLEAVPIAAALEAALQLVDPGDGRPHQLQQGLQQQLQQRLPIERELHVRIPEGLQVWAEPVRLRQILTNLLSNAIKYSPPGTPVEVMAERVTLAPVDAKRRKQPVGAASSGRRMVEIAVQDHGLGIPPEQIPLLFNRFVRLPRDLASSVSGSGLGLYLCRAYAQAMGGDISAESTGVKGEGSVFRLRLAAPPGEALE